MGGGTAPSGERMEIRFETDPAWCQVRTLAFARRAGFPGTACQALAIAVSELAANIVAHAERGVVTLRVLDDPPGIEIEARDEGPGIEDLGTALQDGVSRGVRTFDPEDPDASLSWPPDRSLGCGLGAVRRLMDHVEIESTRGKGTRVLARKWLHGPAGLAGPQGTTGGRRTAAG